MSWHLRHTPGTRDTQEVGCDPAGALTGRVGGGGRCSVQSVPNKEPCVADQLGAKGQCCVGFRGARSGRSPVRVTRIPLANMHHQLHPGAQILAELCQGACLIAGPEMGIWDHLWQQALFRDRKLLVGPGTSHHHSFDLWFRSATVPAQKVMGTGDT